MSNKRQSLQEVFKARQQKRLQKDFIGRTDELTRFSRNLDLPTEERTIIFNISGQGGMGKSYLLRRFRQMAEEQKAFTAWTDEFQPSVVEAMADLAGDLRKKGVSMKSFTDRHERYDERRQELLSSTDAPKELPAFLNRGIRAGIKLAKHAPTVGPVFELIDEESVSSLIGAAGEFISRKFQDNKEDIRLLHGPVETLTPLFLQDLGKAPATSLLALFFDTYENTSSHLDDWLRGILRGIYGDAPSNLLFGIAGRMELDRERWAPYEEFISRTELQPFTREEARTYLNQHGSLQDDLFEEIYRETQGLPVMVALIASVQPGEDSLHVSPNETVVQRFLKWISEPLHQQLAVDAALPRWFNQDTLTVLLASKDMDGLFTWLTSMPFVKSRSGEGGWKYHDIVRARMMQRVQQLSPERWSSIHRRMGEHYETLRDNLPLAGATPQSDERWRKHALEAVYHRICENHGQCPTSALNGFMLALKTERSFARAWAYAMEQAEKDSGTPQIRGYGACFVKALASIDARHYLDATQAFTLILKRDDLELKWQAAALDWRGHLFFLAKRHQEALSDMRAAVALAPDVAEYRKDIGAALVQTHQYSEAITHLDRVLQVVPQDSNVFVLRALAHQRAENHEQSLQDFSQAISLSPPDIGKLYFLRGNLRILLRTHQEALADIEQALVHEPQNALYALSQVDLLMVLGDHARAAEVAESLNTRAEDVVRELKPHIPEDSPSTDKEVEKFHRALGMEPAMARLLMTELHSATRRSTAEGARVLRATMQSIIAAHHCRAERLPEAISAVNQAVELAPSVPNFWAIQFQIYTDAGRHQDALTSIERAEALAPIEFASFYLPKRSLTLAILGRYDEALDLYSQLLKGEPDRYQLLYNIAIAASLRHGHSHAQQEILRARTALLAISDTGARDESLYGLAGLEAVEGNVDKALKLLNEALTLEPRLIGWARYDPAWRSLRNDLRFQALVNPSA